jgi:hypothetical protein
MSTLVKFLRALVAPLGNLGGFIFPVGLVALLSVPGILFYQGRVWLDTGHLPVVSVADGLRWAGIAVPHSTIAGAPLVSDRFLAFPLSLTLLALIGGPLVAYARFSQWLEKRCETAERAPGA